MSTIFHFVKIETLTALNRYFENLKLFHFREQYSGNLKSTQTFVKFSSTFLLRFWPRTYALSPKLELRKRITIFRNFKIYGKFRVFLKLHGCLGSSIFDNICTSWRTLTTSLKTEPRRLIPEIFISWTVRVNISFVMDIIKNDTRYYYFPRIEVKKYGYFRILTKN